MSLDKAILHGKEHRKGYAERGKPGRSDPSCRPNGGCPYCQSNRLIYRRKFDELVAINKAESNAECER